MPSIKPRSDCAPELLDALLELLDELLDELLELLDELLELLAGEPLELLEELLLLEVLSPEVLLELLLLEVLLAAAFELGAGFSLIELELLQAKRVKPKQRDVVMPVKFFIVRSKEVMWFTIHVGHCRCLLRSRLTALVWR